MQRLVEFSKKNNVIISLIYYPPYHSKYNPIENWNGQLLNSVEKILGLARTMQYNGKNPVVKFVNGTYEKGIKLSQKAMK